MGLRNVTAGVLLGGVLVAAVVALAGTPMPWLAIGGYCAVGFVAIAIERGRYRPTVTPGSFAPTAERFRDPVSGELVRVHVDQTGRRDYRRES